MSNLLTVMWCVPAGMAIISPIAERSDFGDLYMISAKSEGFQATFTKLWSSANEQAPYVVQ